MKTNINQHEIPKTQVEEVLYHLKYLGSITSTQANKEYGITRLASAIHDLRKDGWNIKSQDHKFKTRHGRPSQYSEYFLIRFE